MRTSVPHAGTDPAPHADLDRLLAFPLHRDRGVLTRWVPGVLLACVTAGIAWAFISAPSMNWPVVWQYLFNHRVLSGVATTLLLTVLTFALGLLCGIVLAVMRRSGNPVFVVVVEGYIWIFRGTPLLVQLVFWFNLALIFPVLGVSIPSFGIHLAGNTNEIVTPFLAALIGLVLHTAAYMAEVVRGGFLAVSPGQTDAARALGMTQLGAQVRVVIPQAVRVILPPLGNQFIDILKATSMVSVIGGGDLMTQAQQIYGQNYQVIPLLLVASLWYLALVTIATALQHHLERRLDSARRAPRRTRADERSGE